MRYRPSLTCLSDGLRLLSRTLRNLPPLFLLLDRRKSLFVKNDIVVEVVVRAVHRQGKGKRGASSR